MNRLPAPRPKDALPAGRPLKEQMARGVAWMTAARVGVQVLGLLSTMVLARLLTPADFGLIALAMSVVALLETLGNFGFELPLIHKRDATRDDFDTAWTLNILVAGITSGLIVLAAPLAVRFYDEPRIEAILYFVAGGHFLLAFQNIGTVLFRKEMNFRRDFALQITQKLCMLAIAIPLAFAMRNYWALVAGMVAGNVAAVAVSYLFLHYRPRLCLRSSRELLAYSKWLQVTGMMSFVRDRGYVLVMGRFLDAASVGLFSLANEVASLPSTTLIQPLNRAVFPGFARMSHDARQLRDAYRSMLGLIALAALPAAVGVAAVSPLLVPVALGTQWHAAVPLLTLLALAGATRSLTASTVSVHYATGQPRQQTLTVGCQALTLLPAVALGVIYFGVLGAAWAYLLHAVFVFVPICYWILFRTTPVRLPDVWKPIWRPLVASAVMFSVVAPISTTWSEASGLAALPRLFAACSLGALIYAACVVLLWLVSGKPEGAEMALLRRLLARFRGDRREPRR